MVDTRRPNQHNAAAMHDYRDRLAWWATEYKARVGCAGPGPHSGQLTFHHRDRTQKVASVSELITKGKTFGRVMDEIKKCDVLCVACHRRLHKKPAVS